MKGIDNKLDLILKKRGITSSSLHCMTGICFVSVKKYRDSKFPDIPKKNASKILEALDVSYRELGYYHVLDCYTDCVLYNINVLTHNYEMPKHEFASSIGISYTIH